MTLTPLIMAPLEVQIHLCFALVAVTMGPIALFRVHRDRVHKISGYIWLSAMTGLAGSGLFIKSEIALIGHFGPIHGLSVLALWGVFDGLRQAIRRDIKAHEATMKTLWYGAIGVTGLITFLPGRVMNRMMFGAPSELGYVVIGVGLLCLGWLYLS